MKHLPIIAILCGWLVGCEYEVPLIETPETAIDHSLVGLWSRVKDDGPSESLLVLPLDKNQYLVSFPANSNDSMFARACLCQTAGLKFVQLRWIGDAEATLPEDEKIYQFVTYSRRGDTLTVRLLNSDVIPKELKSTEALSAAIAKNKESPNLFREKMVYHKVEE